MEGVDVVQITDEGLEPEINRTMDIAKKERKKEEKEKVQLVGDLIPRFLTKPSATGEYQRYSKGNV